jgi:hypothetical protein
MRVVTQIHEAARADFVAWVRSLGRTPEEQLGFADTYFDDISREMERTHGRPAGVTQLVPGSDSILSGSTRQGSRGSSISAGSEGGMIARWTGRNTLRVLLLGFFNRPPTPEDLARVVRGTRASRGPLPESPPDG